MNSMATSIWISKYKHYSDVIIDAMGSQITSLNIVYSTVYSGADQRKHQRFASPVFAWGILRWPGNSPHKWPVTRIILWNVDTQQRYLTGAKLCYMMSVSNKLTYLLVSIILFSQDRVTLIFTVKFKTNSIAFTMKHSFEGQSNWNMD